MLSRGVVERSLLRIFVDAVVRVIKVLNELETLFFYVFRFDHRLFARYKKTMYGSDIDVNRTRKSINAPKIQRQHVVNNHTPSSVKPGDVISFEMPKLGEHDMIVPGSFYISFKLDVKSDKDWTDSTGNRH